jgi:hypothetical protein
LILRPHDGCLSHDAEMASGKPLASRCGNKLEPIRALLFLLHLHHESTSGGGRRSMVFGAEFA